MTLIEILKKDMNTFRVAAQSKEASAEDKAVAAMSAKALSTVIGRAEQRRKSATDVVSDDMIQGELKSLVEGLTELKSSLESAGRHSDVHQVEQEIALYARYRPTMADVAVVSAYIDELVGAIPEAERTADKNGKIMPALIAKFGKGKFDAGAASKYLASKLS